MPNQPSMADYGKELETAIERRKNLQEELEAANPERRQYLQSSLDAVEQDIRRYDGAIQDHLPQG